MVEAKRSTKFRHQQRKKVEPEIKNARPDFFIFSERGNEQTRCRFG